MARTMTEIITPKEMAEADRLTIEAGTPGIDLMERAGAAVARAASQLATRGRRILVVCGPGNNGGDGFVAARLLAAQGFDVRLYSLGAKEKLAGDAAIAASQWRGKTERNLPDFSDCDVIVDALFGAGLVRNLDGNARRVVEAINAAQKPVLAVDLPSGIDGATGRVRGAAVRVAATITFCRMKPGHLLIPGRIHAGEVAVADIGIPDRIVSAVAGGVLLNTPKVWIKTYLGVRQSS